MSGAASAPTRCKIIRRGFSTELPTRATQRNDVWMWDAWNQANINCPKRNAGRITLPAFWLPRTTDFLPSTGSILNAIKSLGH
jgi:hypothetical protein